MTRNEAAALSWDELEATHRAAYRELQLERAVQSVMPSPCVGQRILPGLETRVRDLLREAQRRHRARPR